MLGKAEWRIRAFAVLIVLLVVFRASASDLERESFSFVGQALVEIGPFGLDVYQARFLKGRSCLLYTSPSPRDATLSRMPSSA